MPAHNRGGWFNKCQHLAQLVMAGDWDAAVEAAEEYYGGAMIFVGQLQEGQPAPPPLAVGASRSDICIVRS